VTGPKGPVALCEAVREREGLLVDDASIEQLYGALARQGRLILERDDAAPRSPVLDQVEAERREHGEADYPDAHRTEDLHGELGLTDAEDAADFVEALIAHDELSWSALLVHRLAEVVDAADPAARRAELVQLAALAVAWAEAIDKRGSP
jgi:hypothetical protein